MIFDRAICGCMMSLSPVHSVDCGWNSRISATTKTAFQLGEAEDDAYRLDDVKVKMKLCHSDSQVA